MILCVQCGRQNKNTSRFCTYCGSRLAEDRCLIARLVELDESTHKEYLVSEADRFLGRDASNDIVLEDDQISGSHLKIFFAGGEFWLEDLGTTNGTFLNGERIEGPVILKNEDLVKIGRTIFKFLV